MAAPRSHRGKEKLLLLSRQRTQKRTSDLSSPQGRAGTPTLVFRLLIQCPLLSATNIFFHTCQSALRKIISHLSLPDFLNYKWYLHIIRIYSSPIPKAKATVSTKSHVSISYKLHTLQFSLFPLLLFHPVFLCNGFCPCDSIFP